MTTEKTKVGRKRLELAGQVFGKLTALEPVRLTGRNGWFWRCRCECGALATVGAGQLRAGNATSCGCGRGRRGVDLTGHSFGKLTVIRLASTNPHGRSGCKWECICTCGSTATVRASNLKSGNTKSCGCGQMEFLNHGSNSQ